MGGPGCVGEGHDVSVGDGSCQDAMEVVWVGHVHSWSKGMCGYALVMCVEVGQGQKCEVLGTKWQRVGCGGPSECSDVSVHVQGQGAHQGGTGTWGQGMG